MESYAVIKSGGKQYRVKEGDVLEIERLTAGAGDQVDLDVIAISDGTALKAGEEASGAAVAAEVVEHLRGKKLIAFKKKRRKSYQRKIGHRQELTRIKVTSVAG